MAIINQIMLMCRIQLNKKHSLTQSCKRSLLHKRKKMKLPKTMTPQPIKKWKKKLKTMLKKNSMKKWSNKLLEQEKKECVKRNFYMSIEPKWKKTHFNPSQINPIPSPKFIYATTRPLLSRLNGTTHLQTTQSLLASQSTWTTKLSKPNWPTTTSNATTSNPTQSTKY